MSEFLPEAVRKGLEEARRAAQRRSNRLCVHQGDKVFRILRMWEDGFAVDASDASKLRGHVQIYDGPKYLSQALVVMTGEEHGEALFGFKWQQAATETAPVDFVRTKDAPAGLLQRF